MKPLVIFLLCAAPATALLAWLGRFDRGTEDLPDEGPRADAPALLMGSDLADPYGLAPFSGAVRRLDGLELRVVEEGYFRLYLCVERLGRHEDKPRLEKVRAAIFDPPKEGRPNLRLRLEASFVRGDPRELLHGAEGAPRVVTLDGGVRAFDAAGRPLAEVESLAIDTSAKTAAADVPVTLRFPERGIEVRGAGLDADLGLHKARLRGPVAASVSDARGTITLRATGGASVEEAEDGARILVTVEGDVRIEHASGRATCPRLDAVFDRADGEVSFRRATLSGGVRLELAPDMARGIETVEMPSLEIEGFEQVSCGGPVRATWRGRLEAVALGERTAKIDAAAASFRLGRAEDGRVLLEEARFEGFRAEDTEGAGALVGRAVAYARATDTLVLEGAVDATTPDGRLAADRVDVARSGRDGIDLLVRGEKRVVYRAEGRLGPLGDGGRGEVRITSTGPLSVRARGDEVSFRAEEEVVATTDGGARLRSDRVSMTLGKGKLVSFTADGRVFAAEPSRGAEITGDAFRYEADAATVEGHPASVSTKDGRSIRAPTITYREDGAFVASGGVDVTTRLSDGAVWKLACLDARGSIAPGGAPSQVEARGSVRAEGPGGEVAEGDALAYDGGKGVATLLGSPARMRRGEEVSLVAPKGLSLRLEKGEVVEGSSLGPSTVEYEPAAVPGAEGGGFRRWRADLRGPARLERDRIIVAKGAALTGSDGESDVLVGEAKRVEILLDLAGKSITAKEIRGSGGVRIDGRGKSPATVTADRLSYVAGTREVRVSGSARVVADGWPRDVRFRDLLFALTKDGIDLRRASDIEVR